MKTNKPRFTDENVSGPKLISHRIRLGQFNDQHNKKQRKTHSRNIKALGTRAIFRSHIVIKRYFDKKTFFCQNIAVALQNKHVLTSKTYFQFTKRKKRWHEKLWFYGNIFL